MTFRAQEGLPRSEPMGMAAALLQDPAGRTVGLVSGHRSKHQSITVIWSSAGIADSDHLFLQGGGSQRAPVLTGRVLGMTGLATGSTGETRDQVRPAPVAFLVPSTVAENCLHSVLEIGCVFTTQISRNMCC